MSQHHRYLLGNIAMFPQIISVPKLHYYRHTRGMSLCPHKPSMVSSCQLIRAFCPKPGGVWDGGPFQLHHEHRLQAPGREDHWCSWWEPRAHSTAPTSGWPEASPEGTEHGTRWAFQVDKVRMPSTPRSIGWREQFPSLPRVGMGPCQKDKHMGGRASGDTRSKHMVKVSGNRPPAEQQ